VNVPAACPVEQAPELAGVPLEMNGSASLAGDHVITAAVMRRLPVAMARTAQQECRRQYRRF